MFFQRYEGLFPYLSYESSSDTIVREGKSMWKRQCDQSLDAGNQLNQEFTKGKKMSEGHVSKSHMKVDQLFSRGHIKMGDETDTQVLLKSRCYLTYLRQC